MLTPKSALKAGIAGKYIKLLIDENQPAQAARAMMHLFCRNENAE